MAFVDREELHKRNGIIHSPVCISDIIRYLEKSNVSIEYSGDIKGDVEGFSSFVRYRENTITWMKKPMVRESAKPATKCIVIEKGLDTEAEVKIFCHNSRRVFFDILDHFWGDRDENEEIDCNAQMGSYVSPQAIVDVSVKIGHGCIISGDVCIGENTILEDRVVLRPHTTIGKDCLIHSGVVLGTDGFGYNYSDDRVPQKIRHFGGVRIGDRVEIGANTCIDRGTIDDTEIGDDTKIDNLVHIAHNVQIGRCVCIIGGASVSGSTIIGDYSYLAPGSITRNGVHVGNNSMLSLGAVLRSDLGDDHIYFEQLKDKTMPISDYRKIL